MAEVQSQPPMERPAVGPDKDDLIEKLDVLLERYLNTLDAYQKAQQQLAKHLSTGYLSLTQANFNNRSPTRFGQDYYDERMQALRKITLTEKDSKVTFSVSTVDEPREKKEASEAKKLDSEAESSSDSANNSTILEKDVPEPEPAKENKPHEEADKPAPKDGKTLTDPIRWFGILVPPALRSAQASFVAAVEGPLPSLATIAKDLRMLEIEVGRLRKQIRKL